MNDSVNLRLKIPALPILAMLILSSMFIIVSNESEVAGYNDYGTATSINIAPGYSWKYNLLYPSDISQYVTMMIQAYGTVYITIWMGSASHRLV